MTLYVDRSWPSFEPLLPFGGETVTGWGRPGGTEWGRLRVSPQSRYRVFSPLTLSLGISAVDVDRRAGGSEPLGDLARGHPAAIELLDLRDALSARARPDIRAAGPLAKRAARTVRTRA
jgi:hypothetical protein